MKKERASKKKCKETFKKHQEEIDDLKRGGTHLLESLDVLCRCIRSERELKPFQFRKW